jgi:hypothetical protein
VVTGDPLHGILQRIEAGHDGDATVPVTACIASVV